MCGIIGCVLDSQVDTIRFQATLEKLFHRGPDDQGCFFDDTVALGHTRLSILDLSMQGHQPMTSQCGRYTIIYNGEIYNFSDIKQKLIKKGYVFTSNSDTEVILNGFIEEKEAIVKQLNGMFAFAVYDHQRKTVFLARDRSGIKPLYFSLTNEGFVFSSEIKAIKDEYSHINQDAVILYLLLGSVPEPMTIYQDIEAFPAGCFATYENKKLSITQYDTYTYEPKINKSREEIIKDVHNLMHTSIERELVSDAPIGTFLSGGIDSSVITAIASKYRSNIQTLSLVFDEKNLSEEFYQNLIVERYNTNHTKYLVNENVFLDGIHNFLDTMEQPTIDGLNTYFVSQAAVESGLKTVLSGVGADEIFYGYSSFKSAKPLQFLTKVPYVLIKLFLNHHKYKKLELLQAESALAYYLPKRGLFSPSEISEILKIDISDVYRLITKLWQKYQFENIKKLEDQVSYFELSLYMKNQLLHDTDVFGMAHSLEIRVPFLDNDLVDYVLRINPELKFDKKINKPLLVEAVKELLPKEIYDRNKMGFSLPFEAWFNANIELFDIPEFLKKRYKNKQLHWSRFWAMVVLQKFYSLKA